MPVNIVHMTMREKFLNTQTLIKMVNFNDNLGMTQKTKLTFFKFKLCFELDGSEFLCSFNRRFGGL